jgi:hypothetical protein
MEGLEMSPEQKHYGSRVPPDFKEFCRAEGYEFREGSSLTRIERQIGGSRFPPELTTFNDLNYAHELTPFPGLQLVGREPVQNLESPPKDVSMRNWLAALGFEFLQQQLGSAQLACSIVLKHGNGNGKRILESITECFPERRQAPTMEEIQESFRRSTLLQTSHSGQSGVYLSPTYEHPKQVAGSRIGILPKEGPSRWKAAGRESNSRTTQRTSPEGSSSTMGEAGSRRQ